MTGASVLQPATLDLNCVAGQHFAAAQRVASPQVSGSIPVIPRDDYFAALFGSDHPLPRCGVVCL